LLKIILILETLCGEHSANALEVSMELTLFGAHANNYLNDSRNYGKKWYDRELDSPDDQLSISLGWMWREKRKK